MTSSCSFCSREIGEGTHDKILRMYESMDEREVAGKKIDFKKMSDRLRQQPDRKVRLLLPGPGDIQICDICVDLYADTVRRELAARD